MPSRRDVDQLEVLGRSDELVEVLQARLRLGRPFLSERFPVPGCAEHVIDEGGQGPARLFFTKPPDEGRESLEPSARLAAHIGRREGRLGQQGARLAGGHLLKTEHGGPPHTAPRFLHGPHECHVVAGVHDQPKIGEGILDLFALVEAHTTDDDIRNARPSQGILEHARLRVGSIEHGNVGPAQPLAAQGQDALGHEIRLLVLIPGSIEGWRLSVLVFRPQRLVLADGVVDNDSSGGGQDAFGRTIVLLQPNDARARVVGLEVENVLHIRAPPLVDGLVAVADTADVAVLAGEQRE